MLQCDLWPRRDHYESPRELSVTQQIPSRYSHELLFDRGHCFLPPSRRSASSRRTGSSSAGYFDASATERLATTDTASRYAAADRQPAGAEWAAQHAEGHAASGKDNPNVKPRSKDDVEAIGNRGVGKGIDFYSVEREIALGKSLAQQVERSSRIVDDPVVSEYVNRVGQNLVRNSDAKVPFTIKVIDSDVVNAFALPGGFFYVDSGLILRADSEAELAGVMAHEIAHVAARHGTRDATKGQLAQLATVPLILARPGGLGGLWALSRLEFRHPAVVPATPA